MAIVKQYYWSIPKNNSHRWVAYTIYYGRRWLSIDTPHNLWWPGMTIGGHKVSNLSWWATSIERQRHQSLVVNNIHWSTLFRVYCCSGNATFVFQCPGCKDFQTCIPRLYLSIALKISKYIVADNVDRQRCSLLWSTMAFDEHLFRSHCGGNGLYSRS